MSFYVLESDKHQAEKLHQFIVEMKAESLHLVTKKQYSKADVCEREVQKAIRELQALEYKRIDVENKIRNLMSSAEQVRKLGLNVIHDVITEIERRQAQ